jgi:cytochrome c551/c552
MQITNVIKSGLLLLALSGLSSCLTTLKEGDATLAFYQKASTATTATTGIGAFQDTFYAFALKNCTTCHATSQSPLFAVSDVNAAYSAANNSAYVSFTAPSASKFSEYAGNGHCGQSGCSGNSQVATDAITAWAAVEISSAGGSGSGAGAGGGGVVGGGPSTGGANAGSFVTATLNIPTTVPISTTTYIPMRWNLTTISPANGLVTAAIFEIEIQKFSTTLYRVRNPKLAGLKQVVKVTGVHVLVKPSTDAGIGVEDIGAGSAWESDVVNVATSTLPGTLPTTPLSTATFPPLDTFSNVIGIRSNQDALTIAFDNLETAGAATLPTFASIYANILQPKCVNCHNTNGKTAGFSYSNYIDTKASVGATPAASRLFTSVTTPSGSLMPIGGSRLSAGDTTAISTWITNGALNN